MMKNTAFAISLLCALSIVTNTASASDDKNPLTLDIQTTVEVGTCMATLQTTSGTGLTTVAFGDVYKPELSNKSKIQNFEMAITNCAGLQDNKADITLIPNGTCAGTTPGANFANTTADGAKATSVEVWTGTPDAGGTQFNCTQQNIFSQDVSLASGNAKVIVPLTARMAIEPGRTIQDVTAGVFTSKATFVVAYK
ncbi:fimbrial protein StaE [Salmonella enterica subsp. enterica serovar Saintpaul]|nr:fimbrial protein StaE [Salmonella enterica subsp. enterica serovar Saintpaul]